MRLTEKAHIELARHIHSGDLVIDATAGNGHDTVKLATLVGTNGQVIAIDIQEAAIKATRARLINSQALERVALHCADHAQVLQQLENQYSEQVTAITFNLGYLPGSDKTVQTEALTTCRALESAKALLKTNGLLSLAAYRGHAGGQDETNQVTAWLSALSEENWQIDDYEPEQQNPERPSPILWLIRKKSL